MVGLVFALGGVLVESDQVGDQLGEVDREKGVDHTLGDAGEEGYSQQQLFVTDEVEQAGEDGAFVVLVDDLVF